MFNSGKSKLFDDSEPTILHSLEEIDDEDVSSISIGLCCVSFTSSFGCLASNGGDEVGLSNGVTDFRFRLVFGVVINSERECLEFAVDGNDVL